MIVRLELEDASRGLKESGEEGFCSDGFNALMFVRQSEKQYDRQLAVLGLEGCLFKTSDPMELGQQLELNLFLDGLEMVLEVRGTVVRLISSRHFTGVGVRFRDLPFESERMIARWMDQRARNAA
jgi:hypothetical protein